MAGLAPPILSVVGPTRQRNQTRGRQPLTVDLHLSQRGRKGFVGGIGRGRKVGDSLSVLTVRHHGAGRFDLTCSFRTLGFNGRTPPSGRVTARPLACPGDVAQVFPAEQEEAAQWPTKLPV